MPRRIMIPVVQFGENGSAFAQHGGQGRRVSPADLCYSRQVETHAPLRVDQQNVGIVIVKLETAELGEKRPGVLTAGISQKSGDAGGKERVLRQEEGLVQPIGSPGGDLVGLDPADRRQLLGGRPPDRLFLAAIEPCAAGQQDQQGPDQGGYHPAKKHP